ncbi:division/cell wall cluster transcriptional repressor MraZ [Tahibacter soli]|uniref:Transcriptional regulator MraZ n=1 Tax=Tahibacter soli TaxID=2983605 RepID=A0A9X3YHN8_9GAMM|nr:division/cell wall cluster transcriptional repressor MraZ [Tahibacter soli]MDC8012594.1 division/cell wall cluster transcriptional repressor MraZ [Tahibacter soli]
MFQGESAITIDEKGRLAVPTSFREQIAKVCGGRLVFTYNPFELGSLWLFPVGEWETLRDQVNALPGVKAVHRAMQMKVVGAAAHVELDSAARILVPASQRAAVGIDRKAVLLGMGSKFELWSEQAHLAKIHQVIGEADITEEMMDLKL